MLENVCLIFAGDPERGEKFQEATRKHGWQITIAEEPEQVLAHCFQNEPDLVVVDDFPDSERARSIFYQLRVAGKGPFLVLNDSPGNLMFSRLGALSFIRMIKRDPEPAELISAVLRLIASSRESREQREVRPTPLVAVNRRPGDPANRPAG